MSARCKWDHNNDGNCHVHKTGCPEGRVIKVVTEVFVPEGATHHTGRLVDNPTWWKCELDRGLPGWWWSRGEGTWTMEGHDMPSGLMEVPE